MLKIIGSASGKHLDAMDFTKVQRCELVWEGKEEFLEHCFEQVPRLQYCTERRDYMLQELREYRLD
jgi:hypothetical protein